jgi:hypothetical protein
MSTRLYAGNLNFDLTDALLREVFARLGGVERAEVMKDRWTGVSRGFGFVDMVTREDADNAIGELDGAELMGRILKVAIAKPRESSRQQSGTEPAPEAYAVKGRDSDNSSGGIDAPALSPEGEAGSKSRGDRTVWRELLENALRSIKRLGQHALDLRRPQTRTLQRLAGSRVAGGAQVQHEIATRAINDVRARLPHADSSAVFKLPGPNRVPAELRVLRDYRGNVPRDYRHSVYDLSSRAVRDPATLAGLGSLPSRSHPQSRRDKNTELDAPARRPRSTFEVMPGASDAVRGLQSLANSGRGPATSRRALVSDGEHREGHGGNSSAGSDVNVRSDREGVSLTNASYAHSLLLLRNNILPAAPELLRSQLTTVAAGIVGQQLSADIPLVKPTMVLATSAALAAPDRTHTRFMGLGALDAGHIPGELPTNAPTIAIGDRFRQLRRVGNERGGLKLPRVAGSTSGRVPPAEVAVNFAPTVVVQTAANREEIEQQVLAVISQHGSALARVLRSELRKRERARF